MIDENSQTWEFVGNWCRAQREKLVNALCVQGLDPMSTENLRGRIAMLDELADLPKKERAAPAARWR